MPKAILDAIEQLEIYTANKVQEWKEIMQRPSNSEAQDRVATAFWEAYRDMANRLADLGELAEKSFVVELPCKPGDEVYIAIKEWDGRFCLRSSFKPCVRKGKIAHWFLSEKGLIACVSVDDAYAEHYEFGKEVFLTKEEAEQALKEGDSDA